jgi:L-seryl-tRNA(Ser) seleniumtransferase
VNEPVVEESLRAGAHLVSFSGDKLLGGPQAGIIAGDAGLVSRCRRNPMFRALRVDKLITGAVETALRSTLFCQWSKIPVLHMISMPADRIKERAESLCRSIEGLQAEIRPGFSVIGGGATPDQPLPTWLVSIAHEDVPALERTLRGGDPPVIVRIEENRLTIDLRTVFETEQPQLIESLRAAAARTH